MEEVRKTPLYDRHVELGGRMVEFGGYMLPVQYASGVIKEHMAVREAVGLFDVSHMGEFVLTGADAERTLNHLLTNDYTGMKEGRARYSPMCNDHGGTVDDLLVYKRGEGDYFLVVNASNREKDFKWMSEHLVGNAKLTDLSDNYGLIAVQGPKADELLKRITPDEKIPPKNYTVVFDSEVGGIPCILARTGYTGEDGFEVCVAAADTVKAFNLLLEKGADLGVMPCGLGARDTLRLEAGMPLYGHEMDDEISPNVADLGFAIKMGKEEFIGKEQMEKEGQEPAVKRCGLKVTGKGIVREHLDVYVGDKHIGVTTSGTKAPFLDYPIAMARLEREYLQVGTKVEVDVRGRRVECEVVPIPFYKRAK